MPLSMLRISFLATLSLANSYSSFRTLSSYCLSREGLFDCLTYTHNTAGVKATPNRAQDTVKWDCGYQQGLFPPLDSFEGRQ